MKVSTEEAIVFTDQPLVVVGSGFMAVVLICLLGVAVLWGVCW